MMVLFFLLGLAVGAASTVAYIKYSGSKVTRVDELESELETTKVELNEYKDKVAGHFNDTADLVNKMTESYKAVYSHLADSAHSLIDSDRLNNLKLIKATIDSNPESGDTEESDASSKVDNPEVEPTIVTDGSIKAAKESSTTNSVH